MKKIFLPLLLFLGFGFNLYPKEPPLKTIPPTSKNLKQKPSEEGKFLDQMLADYTKGAYQSFLKQADNEYREAKRKWKYKELLKQRKVRSSLSSSSEHGTQNATTPFNKKMKTLKEKQNRELIEVCIHYPNAKLSREVKDMIFFTPTQEEKKSLDYLSELNYKFKGEGKNPIENKLISIDIEFWLKALSLEVALTEKKIDAATFQKQSLVLELEKLKQMKEAVQTQGVDPQIKKAIEHAHEIYPKMKAFALTSKHLFSLGQNKTKPQTPVEAQMQKIVQKYLIQEEGLIAEYFPDPKTEESSPKESEEKK